MILEYNCKINDLNDLQSCTDKILSKIDYMAIFGKAFLLNYTTGKDILLREGNNWDVFLNYFFAVFFIFCFIIGILLNPFIIAYHAQQKRTFAKFLFLLVSSMDLFKSLYFPLVLVPKLLSPIGKEDYYYNWDLTSVPWTSHLNKVLALLSMYEIDVLVVLCIVRYNSVVNPLSSSRVRNIVLSSILISRETQSVPPARKDTGLSVSFCRAIL